MKTRRRNIKKPRCIALMPKREPVAAAYKTLTVHVSRDGSFALRTDDGGITWRQVELGETPVRHVGETRQHAGDGRGGAGGSGGVTETIDGGVGCASVGAKHDQESSEHLG